jgi:ElaB/YqjD/DUF883 family membrane-anchored ribosome-binding protein
MAPEEGLGRVLLRTLEELNTLIPKAKKQKDIEALKAKRRKLLKQIETLVETNLDKASQEYATATRGLQTATNRIRKAITDIQKVAEAIEALGEALDLVARLIAV